MISSPLFLEAAVLAIGITLLLLEALCSDDDNQKSLVYGISTIGIGVVLIASFFVHPIQSSGTGFWAFYRADAYALFFKRIALASTLLVLIMSLDYRAILCKFIPSATKEAGSAEFFTIPVFTCLGMMWMASAVDFTMIFVSLELVTISFYIMVSYMRRSAGSLEAGVKYLILGALSTGFLVYGITWIFGVTGQTNLDRIRDAIMAMSSSNQAPLLFGAMLIFVGLGFKIAAAPFQLWVPDVYQGAPTPITAFLSVGSKAAGFVVLFRIVNTFLASPILHDKVLLALAGMAVLTLIYGNLAAMPQTNFKRLLAYSSIAHAGYLLVSLASFGHGSNPQRTIGYYLAGYLLMTLLSFLVLVTVTRYSGDEIASFNGLAQRSPFLAFGLLIAMLSLAGVPFTAGFLGKFLVFTDAIAAHQWTLVAVGVITVGAGFYYYLKVVRAMYWNAPTDVTPIPVSLLTRVTIAVLVVLIIFFGVYPQPIFAML